MSDPISELLTQLKGPSGNVPNFTKLLNSSKSPAGDLLLALRPYLNPKRREKVKEAVSILSLTQIFELFKTFGGE